MLSWDLGKGTECKSVGKYTPNESNKRVDWLKSWLMFKRLLCAQHDVQKKGRRNRRPSSLQKEKEKQIDYILTKRRYLRNVKDAEANDMIHMGSDHGCVMATFLIQHTREGHPCQD